MNNLDVNKAIDHNVSFIRDELKKTGFNKLILGLSGGIDSAVTAALSVKAIGAKNVFCVMMPYKNSNNESLEHAIQVADIFNIKYKIIEITKMVDAYFDNFASDAELLRRGNRMARERMCILFDLSAKYNALVAGTGNRTELMIGYCTQYGDSACAFEPLGNLYKTDVKAIARELGIPDIVIEKNPTADLWEGQTDEAEIGISYRRLDEILYLMLDEKLDDKKIVEKGITLKEIEKVKQMIRKSEFKRNLPPQPELI